MSKTIFITGVSKGFGKLWTEAFLKRGDNVAATSRDAKSLSCLSKQYPGQLLAIPLDITDRKAVFEAVQYTKNYFGTIDVVINNAGYGVFGAIEEVPEKDVKDVFEANVFGTLWVTQAVLPILREQKHGHIIQLSSVLGIYSIPTLGIYNATKYAVEGLSEALAGEVKELGIHITMLEPNGYNTEFGGSSAVLGEKIPAYDNVKSKLHEIEGVSAHDYGDPKATVPVILKLIDTINPPLRLFLGKIGLNKTKKEYAEKIKTWEEWNDVAIAAQG
ncbi:short-chain dehydrogenase/reductase [Chryseobacterium cucumeris]|uniref:SDR family NAD(P)-dependent oxidoreductase n=1 Tax=Chryseobacterium cucumeris TaxID=1813611 RepID=UPI000789864D|nr:SDR family NAD(P)-dependent oxidoreductase [Chryseobacterium cucumeris]KYH07213.1 short-chain dehydrogenase/reductase [Chryseobacterium cucumeris]